MRGAGGDGTFQDGVFGTPLAGGPRASTAVVPLSRKEVRALVDAIAEVDRAGRRAVLADRGLIAPHWPVPWGRDSTPAEQLVIEEELRRAGVRRPQLHVGAWVIPALIAHGTPAQRDTWIPPTLRGDITWCQLFSEPDAGSDLAALRTRARRVEGGWLSTGQKVWTSLAERAQLGFALARTDPDVAKHDGISCFVVDMAAPGVDVRPLRVLSGRAAFNEVFLTGCFVADDAVVGTVGDAWRVGQTTLDNERVSMATARFSGTVWRA